MIHHITSHHITSQYIMSHHITWHYITSFMWHYVTLCDKCDIMWHYVILWVMVMSYCVILWHLKGPPGDLLVASAWVLRESCVRPAWLGGVIFWDIFWRPLLKAQMGQYGPKMVPKWPKKWSENRHFGKHWNINSGHYLLHFVHIGPSKIPPKIDEKIGHYKNWPKIRQHTQNSLKMGPKME